MISKLCKPVFSDVNDPIVELRGTYQYFNVFNAEAVLDVYPSECIP